MNMYNKIAVPSLGDLISLLEADATLPASRNRDLISAVRSVARLLNRNPDELAASAGELRVKLKAVHPVQAGISKKRLANIRSDLAAALKLLPKSQRSPPSRTCSPDWVTFRATLETDWQRYTLSRLARFCSDRGVAPPELSDAVVAEFRTHLSEILLAKDPDEIVKITRQTWNGFVERTGASLPLLTKPPSQRFISRPLRTYPRSFRDDLGAWLKRQSSACSLDDDGPSKPLRPVSLRNIKASIRQFAHALVEAGVRPENLTRLADLIEIETVKKGFRYLMEQSGQRPTSGQANIAAHLVAIATHHVKVEPDELEKLRRIKSRLTVERDGLTEKNKDRLRQFDDERNVARLIRLPEQLARRAHDSSNRSSRDALLVMYAVAIDILLACPMRVGNLTHIDMDKQFRWRSQGRGQQLAIAIAGSEVKNGEAIEIDLPPESVALIKDYLANWRPLIAASPGDALFPARNGGMRQPGHLSQELGRVIHRETGLRMNAHLFRHFAGMLFLAAHPGEFETVRRLLGHRNITTTTNFYASLDMKRVTKRYDDVVLSKRRRMP